ncbi:MAG: NADH-quinone oxidoreductase subunit L [Candidatus Margulisiibacteriota bacterium]
MVNQLLFVFILLLPLLGFLSITGLNHRLSKPLAGWLAFGAVFLSFMLNLHVFWYGLFPHNLVTFTWIAVPRFSLSLSFLWDSLSLWMSLIITGIGALIHLFSIGYMEKDPRFNRFFAYLNLFVFFMLILVLSDNYLGTFIGWEGVGLCSFLLIGFWHQDLANSTAAKKAFIINRIGDLGFLLGILLLLCTFGTLQFASILTVPSLASASPILISTIAVLLLIGAIGKSAQLPLSTWLPDAMAGPTPVSALIHAATMVTAGVYLIARSSLLFLAAPAVMKVMLWIGLATSLYGGLVATQQRDIKKILAYSTVSQLGFMVSALGLGAFSAALFHLTTHAFFKALLFLGAGSVIHAMHEEQDVAKMGGLRKKIPVTFALFVIATLAIVGFPPLSGFFSKDAILLAGLSQSSTVFLVYITITILTAFYSFRLLYLVFFGPARSQKAEHAHESGWSMLLPMGVLGLLSALGGLLDRHEFIHHFLSPSIVVSEIAVSVTTERVVGLATLAILIGIAVATYRWYAKVTTLIDPNALGGINQFLYNKGYLDEVYTLAITRPYGLLSASFNSLIERRLADQLLSSIHRYIGALAHRLKAFQSGVVGDYVLVMIIGLIFILIGLVLR